MPRLRVNAFSLSLDGYGAGPNQNIDDPLGEHGLRLHEWMTPTRTFGSPRVVFHASATLSRSNSACCLAARGPALSAGRASAAHLCPAWRGV